MRALVVMAVLAGVATASPRTKLDPTVSEHARDAERAWDKAGREHDPATRLMLWAQAARAFELVDGDPVDITTKRNAAYACIYAGKQAIEIERAYERDDPPARQPVPAAHQSLIAAISRYVAYTTPTDPEVPPLLFLQARAYVQFDQLEAAIPIYRTLIAQYPTTIEAKRGAHLLFDAYGRLGKLDELFGLADELATTTLARGSLAPVIARVHVYAQRVHAEELERAALASHDPDAHRAAAQAYLDIYSANPRAPDGDEPLYNAAVLLLGAGDTEAAIRMFETIEATYPQRPISRVAVRRRGQLHAMRGEYARAADAYERFARWDPTSVVARPALADALAYRIALRDRTHALADATDFVRHFGAKHPDEAAQAIWSVTPLLASSPKELVAHLRRYIEDHGATGRPADLVAAHTQLGLALLAQSCPRAQTNGQCVRVDDSPRTCGTGRARVTAPIARTRRTVADATRALEDALRLATPLAPDTSPDVRASAAQARLALADLAFESYLAIASPRALDITSSDRAVREASLQRFASWLDDKTDAGARARTAYDLVFASKDPATSIAAAQRTALLTESLASILLTAPLPRAVTRTPDATTAHCEAIARTVEPLAATSVAAYGVCLATSTELGWFTEASTDCERALLRLRPDEYPPLRELRSPATFPAAPLVTGEPAPTS